MKIFWAQLYLWETAIKNTHMYDKPRISCKLYSSACVLLTAGVSLSKRWSLSFPWWTGWGHSNTTDQDSLVWLIFSLLKAPVMVGKSLKHRGSLMMWRPTRLTIPFLLLLGRNSWSWNCWSRWNCLLSFYHFFPWPFAIYQSSVAFCFNSSSKSWVIIITRPKQSVPNSWR